MGSQSVLRALCMVCAVQCGAALGWELAGSKTLTAHTRDKQAIVLGSVLFEPQSAGGTAFSVQLDHARFKDHFLSMKEFKCVEGGSELMCHVPYPYAQPRTVATGDFAWLEHSLMFLFKQPSEFGAKLWNGLYYRFELTDKGLVGLPQAIDLNYIGAPPKDLTVPPYRKALRDDVAPGTRWVERLTIE